MTTLAISFTETLFAEHRAFLWGLCYRLTGSAADADDLVQETFVRAMEHPPARTEEPWRPWLVRVALNLGRDFLRRRKRRTYVGPWLPSPIDTSDEAAPPSHEPTLTDGVTTEGRYDLVESVSFAFLIALEALTPQQRAVLLLREVFDYSVQETAEALNISEANVKTTLHRARRTMRAYDQARCVPTRTLQERTRHTLDRFLHCLFTRDIATLESLLAADVRLISDGGGEFRAALKPIIGREKVLRFYRKAMEHARPLAGVTIRTLNGLPTLILEFKHLSSREAPLVIHQSPLGPDGRITTIYAVLASSKLRALHR